MRPLPWLLALSVCFATTSGADARSGAEGHAPPVDRAKAQTDDAAKPAADEIWKVPVGKSPIRGPRNAPVTLVVFSDFQCPFCQRLATTLDALVKKYPRELRVVFKHRPLPFHAQADDASHLAIEAQKKRGDRGFWDAHDALFARGVNALSAADLAEVAKELKLDPVAAMAAVEAERHLATIEEDEMLADEVGARGTPMSFINGRKVRGAQPIEAFERIIDEEIAHAKELRAKGVPAFRLYDHIIKDGKTEPLADKVKVTAPTSARPAKGARTAPVTIQVFTDFECPFCQRALSTLEKIEQRHGKDVRIVFRNLPLAFHKNARSAHALAMEAFQQQGDRGFWRVHDLLFQNQRALTMPDLLGHAQSAGIDTAGFEEAIRTGKHDAAIDADIEAADKAGIRGTPSFVINDYLVVGAQPYSKFRRVIDAALKEARGGKR